MADRVRRSFLILLTRILQGVSARVARLRSSERLLARCARGGTALAVGTVVERAMRLVRNMVLARLLAPDQFGLMAIIIAASGLLEVLTEAGIRQSIVQHKEGDTEPFLNVAWWFSSVRACALYAMGFLLAPWIASFYQEEQLPWLLRVSFLTMLFNGLTSPRLYVMEKHLRFGQYVWLWQGSGLLATAVSLLAGVYFRDVWALVLGLLTEPAARCLASFVVCPIRPRLSVDRRCAGELFHFARGWFGLPLLTAIVMQADIFVLGKICSKHELGMYSLAVSLASMPMMLFGCAVQPLILPALSTLQSDLDRLRDALLRMTSVIFLFGIPVTTCLAIFGRSILSLVYGGKYSVMAAPYSILCVYVLLWIAGTVIMSTYTAISRPALHRRFALIRLVLVAVLIYPAAKWFGPVGAAATLMLCQFTASLFQCANLAGIINLPVRRYWLTAVDGLVLGGIVSVPALLVLFACPQSASLQVGAAVSLIVAAWLCAAWRLHNAPRVTAAFSADPVTNA